jgi:glycosyltransferase involved in cell wall biosynthesis
VPDPTHKPRVLLAYHFFHPDDVVSARLFTDLAVGLSERGWDVTVLTSDRSWADSNARHAAREEWKGVTIERAHRPAWPQSRPMARLANAAWLINAWRTRLQRIGHVDAAVVGSDPSFAPLLTIPMRRRWPDAGLAHWCFDLYPEVVVAESGTPVVQRLASVARRLMAVAYARCDAVVDLGPRMRERLSDYPSSADRHTIAPWALVEPPAKTARPDPALRSRMFGPARVGLLYSGTMGRAHDFEPFLQLARSVRHEGLAFCFSCRGHRLAELRAALGPGDTNVFIDDFSDEAELADRLEIADVHLMSLKASWSGFVVPSKFFGSLAVGRPVVYAGPPDSDLARLVAELGVGWVIGDIATVAQELTALARSPDTVTAMRQRARAAYYDRFAKKLGIDAWDTLLRDLVTRRRAVRGDRFVEPHQTVRHDGHGELTLGKTTSG